MKLTERLLKVAQLCAGAHTVIDVGCDHAKLPIYLIENGMIEQAVATDIRKGPVAAAQRNIDRAKLRDKIKANLCNGLTDFSAEDGDCVVVAGMGGDEIVYILSEAPWLKSKNHVLVLQPQTQEHKLRKFLREQGFAITAEEVAVENKRVYIMLKAQWQEEPLACENYDLFSTHLEGAQNRCFYIHKLINRYRKQFEGCLVEHGYEDATIKQYLTLLQETLQRYQQQPNQG